MCFHSNPLGLFPFPSSLQVMGVFLPLSRLSHISSILPKILTNLPKTVIFAWVVCQVIVPMWRCIAKRPSRPALNTINPHNSFLSPVPIPFGGGRLRLLRSLFCCRQSPLLLASSSVVEAYALRLMQGVQMRPHLSTLFPTGVWLWVLDRVCELIGYGFCLLHRMFGWGDL